MNPKNQFDLVVIGGGPGGYPAAIKAAQLGLTVALVEKGEMGGTCLNRGCIPSKALISNADALKKIQEAEEFGILVGSVQFDFSKMAARKDRVVARVRRGLEGLIAANQITLFKGVGKIVSPREVKVLGDTPALLSTNSIIIATGSEPRLIPAFPFDHKIIYDSTSLLARTELPESLAIIGGGVIGCEFASLYSTLGVRVTLIELMPSIIPMECKSVSSVLTKAFQRKGIEIITQAMVERIDTSQGRAILHLAGGSQYNAEIALVAIGRTMNTQGIGLEELGIPIHQDGTIQVNDRMETPVKGVYAVGDIASRWWLAHVASHQGLVAASNVAGIPATMHYNAIPSVIFTDPEIATVGLTLEAAIAAGHNASLGAFPFHALGKSQAALQTDGFAQIVVDKETGLLLGAQVVGHEASTLVAEMGVAIANGLTLQSITDTIHAHPTVAEVWMEAALVASETPLHFPPKAKGTKE